MVAASPLVLSHYPRFTFQPLNGADGRRRARLEEERQIMTRSTHEEICCVLHGASGAGVVS